ncbi:MAG: hypothetical protein AB2L14_03620 [Candidatus Xenobiia bacterium LiM19]
MKTFAAPNVEGLLQRFTAVRSMASIVKTIYGIVSGVGRSDAATAHHPYVVCHRAAGGYVIDAQSYVLPAKEKSAWSTSRSAQVATLNAALNAAV